MNFSETKLPPTSDIIFLGSPHFEKMILHASIRLSTYKLSVFLVAGNVLW